MTHSQTPPPPPAPPTAWSRNQQPTSIHLIAVTMFSSGFCVGVSVITLMHALVR